MRRILAYVVIAIVVLVAVAGLTLATPFGRGIVVSQIERAAASAGLTLSIEGATGWPPFTLGAQRITVADADGVFAEVDNLGIDIKTTALLAGRLALDSLYAERIAVERQPHLPSASGGSGAALPFAADAVNVPRLELGADLVGRAAVLKLAGSLSSGANGRLVGTVNAERIDGRTGTLAAKFDRTNGSAPIAADIELAEDADGILVGLIGRTAGPGYRLQAKSNVDGDNVRGSVSLASNGAARFTGDFSLAPADGGSRITVNGNGDLAELVPPEYADLLSGPIALAVDADWTQNGTALPSIAVRQGSLSTANLRAAVSGTFSDTVADLTVQLDAAKAGGGTLNVPLTSPQSQIETLSLAGKVAPSGNSVRMELTGRATGLNTGVVTIPGLGISLAIEAPRENPLAAGQLSFAARAEANAVQTATGRIESVGGAPVVLTADGTIDTTKGTATTNAKLNIAGGTANFTGTIGAGGAKGDVTADFADVSLLSPLAGRSIGGALSAKASGTFGVTSAFRITANGNDFDPGEATLARLLRGKTDIAATIGVKPEGVSVDDLSINGAALSATGQFAFTGGTVTGSAKGNVADLALLADQSSGAATFDATISGEMLRPAIDANVTIASGTLLGQQVDNAKVTLASSIGDNRWSAALTLAGGFAGKPLTGRADATLDATGALSFPSVDLNIGDNRITGAIARTPEGPLSGTLAVDAPNLATLAALALVPASGQGEARITFAPDGAKQSLAVTFNGSGVTYQSIAAGKISGDVHIDDAFGTPLVTGNASGSALNIGGLQIDTASANTSVSGGATQFSAKAHSRDLDLNGNGSLSASNGGNVLRVDALNGTAYRLPVQLNAPVSINLGGQTSGISGAVLAIGGGTIRIDGTVAPALNLTVAVNQVAASVVNGFAPLGAEGSVTGTARITGTGAAPAIAWQADWTGARVDATRKAGLPGLTLSARGNATGKNTDINARLTGAGMDLTITGAVPFAGSGLNVQASGTAPLALLALESNRELRLAGTARVNLAVTGSVNAIATSGTVDLSDATVADTDSGFGIAGATGRIAFDGQRATVQSLTGRLAQGGDISVAGSVGIADSTLPAQLTIRVNNGRYADGRTINTTFSGDLAINGPILGNGIVSGTINLGRTEIQLPDRLAGSATAIDVKHVNAPKGFKPPVAREPVTRGGPASGGSGGLRLDVNLAGGSGIFVRGFGIDSELGGSLHLTGTTGNPQTAGGFQMRRGRMEALGRRFEFQSGELTFAGDLVPYLSFEATTTTSDGTVTLHVTGPASNPQITFTSSPEMPQEEILSRLLFSRSVGTLSPLQAAQLIDAVAQLTGVSQGGGIFARIREATGLDDLDIRQSANGGTTVGVAKRINDNIRVGVEAGTTGSEGRVVIDLDLTKNLKARGEAGQDGAGKIGLTYEHEY